MFVNPAVNYLQIMQHMNYDTELFFVDRQCFVMLRLAQSVRLALSFTAIVQLLHLVSSLAHARALTHIDTVRSDVSVHPCAISDHKANRRNAPVSLLV